MIANFWKYYKRAQTVHQIQVPFVRQLLEECLDNDKQFYDFAPLEHLRYTLSQNKQKISVTDLGAGSRVDKGAERIIGRIAKNAVSPTWQCQFLFRLVNWLGPQYRLEIGTSLGVNSLYQYLPLRNAPFYTLEGCPNIAAIAQKNFDIFNAKHIQLEIGDFAETLPLVLAQMQSLDYVFIDGNHQQEPTIQYFEQCLAYSHDKTIIVLDDIHWSTEMETAWEYICQHNQVALSIDLYYLGLVFLDKSYLPKKHLAIIPSRFKPWQKLLG